MKTNYQQQSLDFLRKTNTKIEIVFFKKMAYFEEDKKDNVKRDVYNVVIKNARYEYKLKFGASIRDTENKIKPDEYDILACLTHYEPGTFEDFCCNYGYNNDSITASNIYKACKEEYEAITKLFNEQEMEELIEIQ